MRGIDVDKPENAVQTDTYHVTLGSVGLDTDDPRAKALLEEAKRKTGMVPNMYKYMANAPALLDMVLHGYDLFHKETSFTRAEQEVIFLTLSRENGCDYCMAAHSFMADLAKVPLAVTEAVREDREVPDERLQALSRFAEVMVRKSGHPSDEDVAAFLAAGYTEKHILEVILAAGIKTLTNYANHVFHTPVDKMFRAHEWKAFQLLNRATYALRR